MDIKRRGWRTSNIEQSVGKFLTYAGKFSPKKAFFIGALIKIKEKQHSPSHLTIYIAIYLYLSISAIFLIGTH